MKLWPWIEHYDNLGSLFLQVGSARSPFSLPSASVTTDDTRVKFRDYLHFTWFIHLVIRSRTETPSLFPYLHSSNFQNRRSEGREREAELRKVRKERERERDEPPSSVKSSQPVMRWTR